LFPLYARACPHVDKQQAERFPNAEFPANKPPALKPTPKEPATTPRRIPNAIAPPQPPPTRSYSRPFVNAGNFAPVSSSNSI
jgi:hypothetical protein